MTPISYIQNGSIISMNYNDGNYIQNDPFKRLTSPFKGLPFPNSSNIILTPRKVNFQLSTLGNSQHLYFSPYYQDIIALANYFADWNCSYDILEGPVHTINVNVPWDTLSGEDFSISDFASEQWEIVSSQDQKSIITSGILANPFNPPTANGNYVVLPDILKVAVQRAYENKTITITTPSGSLSSSYAPFIPYASQMLNYLRGGVEGIPSYTQVLKRTAVIDVRNTNRAFQKLVDTQRQNLNAQGTVNYIYSTRDMINNYSIQSNAAALMMPSYKKLITVTGLEPTNYYAYAGWLVKQPTCQFITRNKLQLTQEFIWNEWISGLYYIYSPANHFQTMVNPSSSPAGFAPS